MSQLQLCTAASAFRSLSSFLFPAAEGWFARSALHSDVLESRTARLRKGLPSLSTARNILLVFTSSHRRQLLNEGVLWVDEHCSFSASLEQFITSLKWKVSEGWGKKNIHQSRKNSIFDNLGSHVSHCSWVLCCGMYITLHPLSYLIARNCNSLAAGGRWLRMCFSDLSWDRSCTGGCTQTFCVTGLGEVLLIPGNLLICQENKVMGVILSSIKYFAHKYMFLLFALENEQKNLLARGHKGNL